MSCEKNILIRSSNVQGVKPDPLLLLSGELAINTFDGIIYALNEDGNVVKWVNNGLAVVGENSKIIYSDSSNMSYNNSNNVWSGSSDDIGDNQNAFINFEIRSDIAIDWESSSESGYDFLKIKFDGDVIIKKSGEKSGTLNIPLGAIDMGILEIKYSKDGSVSHFNDNIVFSNLRATS
jgi:hypothetical protein